MKSLRVNALCLFVIACLGIKVAWSIASVWDIPLADETIYLTTGLRLFVPGPPNGPNGLPAAEWSPLYAFWYAFLHIFQRNPSDLYFFNWSALVVLLSMALFVLQRALGAPAPLALAASFALMTSQYFEVLPYPVHWATVVLLTGTVLAVRARSSGHAALWTSCTFLVCTYVRPDFIAGFVVCVLHAAYMAFSAWRAKRFVVAQAARRAAPVAALGVVLVAVFGFPLSKGRLNYAFQQHYALSEVKRLGLTIDPWTDFRTIVERDFPGATDLLSTIRINPRAFALHIGHNILHGPDALSNTFEPTWMLSVRAHHAVQWVETVLAIIGFLGIVHIWRSGSIERIRLQRFAMTVLAILATCLPSALIVYPRAHYLLPITAMITIMTTVGLPAAVGWLRTRLGVPHEKKARFPITTLTVVACLLFAIAPNRAHGWCVQSLIAGPPAEVHRPFMQLIAGLSRIGIRQPVTVLEPDWSFAVYSMPVAAFVEPWRKDRSFLNYVRDKNVNVVILPDELLNRGDFRDDPSLRDFLADPASAGFRIMNIPGSTERIAIRNDVPVAG